MPCPEENFRTEPAVLWVASGVDRYGNPKVSSPIEVQVRWEEVQSQALDPNGGPITIDATVTADQLLPVGSVLWRGSLSSLPSVPIDLKSVAVSNRTPDIKGRKVTYTAHLSKLSDTLPTLNP